MGQHLRGKLGPAGRIELVRLMREDGLSERAAAAALSVAPSTAHHWSVRERRADAGERSEEHTSELQSHSDLVCRLLLEKKKKYLARLKLRYSWHIAQVQYITPRE